MANSSGKQDLIVNIISADKRYEVANYKNVFIPTNFDVKDSVKTRFGEFYAALFDKTVEANPGAVVTEYAWTAVPNYHCDPCTNADVTNPDLMTLGGDVIGGQIAAGTFVLTRLHARYGKDDMKDDLRFREAKPVTGGREQWSKQGPRVRRGAVGAELLPGALRDPPPLDGTDRVQEPAAQHLGRPARRRTTSRRSRRAKVAFAPRGKLALGAVIGRDLWEIGYKKDAAQQPGFAKPPGGKAMGFGLGALLAALGIGLGMMISRRRR